MTIKLLLICAFALVAVTAVRLGPSPKHLLMRRLAVIVSFCCAGSAVLFPDLVTAAANAVGVGRGADLVLYALVVASAVVWLSSYRRTSELEERLTRLVRAQALAGAVTFRPAEVSRACPCQRPVVDTEASERQTPR